jgi:hypothetical protein
VTTVNKGEVSKNAWESFDEGDPEVASEDSKREEWLRENVPPHHL